MEKQLSIQKELALQGDVFFGNFKRPNSILIYGQPNVGKCTMVKKVFSCDNVQLRIYDLKKVQDFTSVISQFGNNNESGSGNITMYVRPNDPKRHHVYIIRHLEKLLRPNLSVEIQEDIALAIREAKKRPNTTIIGTLGGNIPTAFIPAFREVFDFQYHCPLPTPEERVTKARSLLDEFARSGIDITIDLNDEDWNESFADATRYADYGLIHDFLRKLVCNVNGLWIANGKSTSQKRIIDRDLLDRTYVTWDNTPCIVEADLAKRSMHTRNYAISNDKTMEYTPSEPIKDPTQGERPLKKRRK